MSASATRHPFWDFWYQISNFWHHIWHVGQILILGIIRMVKLDSRGNRWKIIKNRRDKKWAFSLSDLSSVSLSERERETTSTSTKVKSTHAMTRMREAETRQSLPFTPAFSVSWCRVLGLGVRLQRLLVFKGPAQQFQWMLSIRLCFCSGCINLHTSGRRGRTRSLQIWASGSVAAASWTCLLQQLGSLKPASWGTVLLGAHSPPSSPHPPLPLPSSPLLAFLTPLLQGLSFSR